MHKKSELSHRRKRQEKLNCCPASNLSFLAREILEQLLVKNTGCMRKNNQSNKSCSIFSKLEKNLEFLFFFYYCAKKPNLNVQFTQRKEVKYRKKGDYFRILQRIHTSKELYESEDGGSQRWWRCRGVPPGRPRRFPVPSWPSWAPSRRRWRADPAWPGWRSRSSPTAHSSTHPPVPKMQNDKQKGLKIRREMAQVFYRS